MFIIKDERHAEPQEGEYASYDEAMAELHRLATIPWDEPPNKAPCMSWRTCGRHYEIVQYDTSQKQRVVLQRWSRLAVSASGIEWIEDN